MKQNISTIVRELAAPVAAELAVDIWDVEYVKQGSSYYLRITLDKPEGITIDDCEAFHRRIDTVLDEADPIEGSYYLEVSSPGIGRELKTKEHFQKQLGETVQVRFYAPLDQEFGSLCGLKEFCGVLCDASDDGILMRDASDNEYSFPYKLISKANTVFEF